MSINKVQEILCQPIVWKSTKDEIAEKIIKHYIGDKDQDAFIRHVDKVWNENGRLKLLDGSYMRDSKTYHPFVWLITNNTRIVMDAIHPDAWGTLEQEDDLPEMLRTEWIGVYDVEKVRSVEKKFALKVSL